MASQCSRKPPPARPELWGSTTARTAWAVTRASMALPPFFSAASAAVLASGLAVTTTADPRAVEMPLLLVSLDSGSSRLIGAAAAGRVLQRLSASSNALSWGSTALDRLVSVLWLVRRTAGLPIKKKSRPLSPLLLDALKAPQEWIGRGPFEVRSERFSGNSQEILRVEISILVLYPMAKNRSNVDKNVCYRAISWRKYLAVA